MPRKSWILGTLILLVLLGLILTHVVRLPMAPHLPMAGFVERAVYVLILAAVICLIRLLLGPTAADRIVAIDILGILILGICAILSIATQRSWYIDIGIAWGLQSFIGALALSKHLEGRGFDE